MVNGSTTRTRPSVPAATSLAWKSRRRRGGRRRQAAAARELRGLVRAADRGRGLVHRPGRRAA